MTSTGAGASQQPSPLSDTVRGIRSTASTALALAARDNPQLQQLVSGYGHWESQLRSEASRRLAAASMVPSLDGSLGSLGLGAGSLGLMQGNWDSQAWSHSPAGFSSRQAGAGSTPAASVGAGPYMGGEDLAPPVGRRPHQVRLHQHVMGAGAAMKRRSASENCLVGMTARTNRAVPAAPATEEEEEAPNSPPAAAAGTGSKSSGGASALALALSPGAVPHKQPAKGEDQAQHTSQQQAGGRWGGALPPPLFGFGGAFGLGAAPDRGDAFRNSTNSGGGWVGDRSEADAFTFDTGAQHEDDEAQGSGGAGLFGSWPKNARARAGAGERAGAQVGSDAADAGAGAGTWWTPGSPASKASHAETPNAGSQQPASAEKSQPRWPARRASTSDTPTTGTMPRVLTAPSSLHGLTSLLSPSLSSTASAPHAEGMTASQHRWQPPADPMAEAAKVLGTALLDQSREAFRTAERSIRETAANCQHNLSMLGGLLQKQAAAGARAGAGGQQQQAAGWGVVPWGAPAPGAGTSVPSGLAAWAVPFMGPEALLTQPHSQPLPLPQGKDIYSTSDHDPAGAGVPEPSQARLSRGTLVKASNTTSSSMDGTSSSIASSSTPASSSGAGDAGSKGLGALVPAGLSKQAGADGSDGSGGEVVPLPSYSADDWDWATPFDRYMQQAERGNERLKEKPRVPVGRSLREDGRQVAIVTTASLPWMTGTAVNPLLRAAYLSKDEQRKVTLVIPWLNASDQDTLFPGDMRFSSPEEQEAYVRDWARKRTGLDCNFRISFYPGRYAADKGSIMPMGDITQVIPDSEADVAVLEEPEHLTWAHHGTRWTDKFNHVVGVMHTNYLDYVKREDWGPLKELFVKHLNSWVCRAHCHKVIKLSDAVQPLPREQTMFVHGVSPSFLKVGQRKAEQMRALQQQQQQQPLQQEDAEGSAAAPTRTSTTGFKVSSSSGGSPQKAMQGALVNSIAKGGGSPWKKGGPNIKGGRGAKSKGSSPEKATAATVGNSSESSGTAPEAPADPWGKGVYFIGKVLWAKGYTELLQRMSEHAERTGNNVDVDVFGGGPDLQAVREAAAKKKLNLKFNGPRDHADQSIQDYKVFVNPSLSDVVATTTAEALAMGKWVVCADHPSNRFFARFPNCLIYKNSDEFSRCLSTALSKSPQPLGAEDLHALSWEAATERFLDVAEIDKWQHPLETAMDSALHAAHNTLTGIEAVQALAGGGSKPGEASLARAGATSSLSKHKAQHIASHSINLAK